MSRRKNNALEDIDDDYQTRFDPELSEDEKLEEDVEDETTSTKTGNGGSPGVDNATHATPTTSVSVKASKLANTFRSLYKPSGLSSLKDPPELRGRGAGTDAFLPSTIDTHASTTPSTMSGLSGPSSSLRASSYRPVPHGHIPVNEKTTDGDMDIIKMGEVKSGAPGHKWFLTVRLPVTHDLSGREILLGGLAAVVELLSALILNFKLHPVDNIEHYPDIVSHLVEDGFPEAAAVAFYYFKMRNKRLPNQGPNSTAPTAKHTQPQQHRFDDDAGWNGPQSLFGTICVSGNVNIKEAVENVGWDVEDTGIKIDWKRHQSSESSSQIIIVGVPKGHCWAGAAYQIRYWLKDVEKKMCTQGKVDSALFDVPLPEFVVHWAGSKKGRSRNKAEEKYSLNNLQLSRDNGASC